MLLVLARYFTRIPGASAPDFAVADVAEVYPADADAGGASTLDVAGADAPAFAVADAAEVYPDDLAVADALEVYPDGDEAEDTAVACVEEDVAVTCIEDTFVVAVTCPTFFVWVTFCLGLLLFTHIADRSADHEGISVFSLLGAATVVIEVKVVPPGLLLRTVGRSACLEVEGTG